MARKRTATLSDPEEGFCLEYLSNGLNATRAYKAVHPRAKTSTATTEGHKTLRKPHVAAFLATEQAARKVRLQMDGDEALEGLTRHARGDPRRLFKGNRLLPMDEWPDDAADCVKALKPGPFGTAKKRAKPLVPSRRRDAKPLKPTTRLVDADSPLTPPQEAFVLHYLSNGWNGTRAYLASHPRCTYESAATGAYESLRNAKIRARLQRELSTNFKALQMNADESLARLSIVGRADILDAYDDAGKMRPLREWPANLRLALKSVKRNAFGDYDIVFDDRVHAVELMAINGGKLSRSLNVRHGVAALAKIIDGDEGEDA